MNTMLLVSLTIVAGLLLVTVHAKPSCNQCGVNEEWTTCGTACPKTCENPNPRVCTLQCLIGCQCVQGYVRNKDGKCINPSGCCKSSG